MSEREDRVERETGPDNQETCRAEDSARSENKGKQPESNLFDWIRTLVGVVVVLVLVFTFLAQTFTVEGPSMQPTLYGNDKLLVIKATWCQIQQGDIVVVRQYNAELDDPIVKRVIATGGQTVDIDFETGTVYVDGTALEESYIPERTFTAEGMTFPLTLGEGELFLMGDNRNHSTDSRNPMLGVVDERYVVGKAVLLLLPGRNATYLGEYTGSGEIDFSRIGLL